MNLSQTTKDMTTKICRISIDQTPAYLPSRREVKLGADLRLLQGEKVQGCEKSFEPE